MVHTKRPTAIQLASPLAGQAKAQNRRMLMADIAKAAGVSTATVSRALSGHPAISVETRERITSLATALNYQINIAAANLRKRDVKTVSLMILNDSMQMISDPFILSLVGHIADTLDAQGLNLLLSRSGADNPAALAAPVESGQVLGLLVIGQATHHAMLNALADREIPMVVWGGLLPDTRYCVVGGDNLQGGYLATRHLLEAGCRRIAFLGDRVYPEVAMRYEGYVKALTEHGQQARAELEQSVLFHEAGLQTVVENWIDSGISFDGMFCTSDVAALNVISVLTRRGIAVPEQVKVVGYDDVPMSAHVHPSITTIRQPTGDAARYMVSKLLEQMEHHPSTATIMAAELVQRQSSR